MHEYYRNNILKLKKENEGYLRFVKVELEQNAGKPYSEVWEEIWGFYEKNLLEHFPYIGGDKSAGQRTSLALTFLWRWARYLNATVFLWRVRHV